MMKPNGEEGWKRHFKLSMFSLEYNDPSRFVHGPWRRKAMVHPMFLLYRLVFAIYVLQISVFSFISVSLGVRWFMYFTHWGLFITTVEAIVGAVLVLNAYQKQNKPVDSHSSLEVTSTNGGKMPLSYKIYWVSYNMALPNAFYITAVYWIFSYDPNVKMIRNSQYMNYFVHIGNSIVALLDLILGGPPSKLLHFVQPLGFALIYMLFTIIFWVCGGTDAFDNSSIYKNLQWDNVGDSCMLMFLSGLLIIFFHVLVTIVSGLRSRLTTMFRQKSANISSDRVSQTPYSIRTSNKSSTADTS